MFKSIGFKNIIVDLFYGTIGSILIALGTAIFLLPFKISTGGFSGIATIFYYLYKIKIGSIVLIMNIPLFIIGFFVIGKYFFIKTIYSTWLLSYSLNVFESLNINININDQLLATIFGGLIVGLGTSMVFLGETSTGGSELLTQIISNYSKKIKVSKLIIIIDSIVVMLNLVIFKQIEIGLYSLIAIYLNAKVLDIISEGINFSKVVYVVSSKPEQIADIIINELEKGVTGIYGKGMYKKEERLILVCVVKNRDVLRLKRIVYRVDKNAFMFINDSTYVYGLRV